MAIPAHIGQRDPGDGSYNPGLQTDIEPVTRDNQIYEDFIAGITEGAFPKFQVDLFGRSPLSGLLGFWNQHTELTVSISSPDIDDLPDISHTYSDLPVNQVITLPVLGLVARAGEQTTNRVSVYVGNQLILEETFPVSPLPQTDAENDTGTGFPVAQLRKPATQSRAGDDLYYVMLSERRANIAYDRQGYVRWYVRAGDVDDAPELWLPVFNTVRLSDGTFIGSDDHLQQYYTPSDLKENEPLGQRELWRFDATGRVLGIYFIRDRAHHSLAELPGENALLYASDYISARNDSDGPINEANQGPSAEDCIAILDLATGYEKVYYDLRIIMNFWRPPVPTDLSVPHIYDWIHLNQVYLDTDSNLLMGSCRHQSAIIGIDRETGALQFIAGNHDDWQITESGEPTTDWSDLLLTPVNPSTKQPCALDDVQQKEDADQSFWTWGQHNIQERVKTTSDPDVVEFSVFNNGNYRTRDITRGVVASKNASRCARYQITRSTRQIEKLEEYGETEVGAAGYSSYVSTAHFFSHNGDPASPRLFANFGGAIFQDNGTDAGLPLTLMPGESDRQDPAENVQGNYQGRAILQEVDLTSHDAIFELWLTSGTFKNPGSGTLRRAELYAFRAYKMPLYP